MTSQEIKAKVDKQIADFKKTLKPDEIANSLEEFNPKKHKLILGNCDFQNRKDITDLGVLEMIGGFADFRVSKVENLGNLTTIGGSAYFRNSKVEKLGNLTTIGNDAYFEDSIIENLGNLTTIGGDAIFSNSKVENLGNLTTIGGSAFFGGSIIENLGNLTTIGGDADFRDSKIENLGNLTTIGGKADFSESKVENLGNLTTIGLYIYANGNKLTRQQVIDHLNKMNQNFFVIRNSLYGIEKDYLVASIRDKVLSIKKGMNSVNVESWKLQLGKINLNSDGTFGFQFKMYS